MAKDKHIISEFNAFIHKKKLRQNKKLHYDNNPVISIRILPILVLKKIITTTYNNRG